MLVVTCHSLVSLPFPPSLVSYVREQLLHTVALMVKRATLEEDRRKLFDSVFSTVSQLLAMDSKMVTLSLPPSPNSHTALASFPGSGA